MAILKIKILAEDIQADNYGDMYNCPITKALARAGRPDLIECVGLYNKADIEAGNATAIMQYSEYKVLDDTLFAMYNSLPHRQRPDKPMLEIADFEYDWHLPDSVHRVSDFVIDEAVVKATQTDFVEKK